MKNKKKCYKRKTLNRKVLTLETVRFINNIKRNVEIYEKEKQTHKRLCS